MSCTACDYFFPTPRSSLAIFPTSPLSALTLSTSFQNAPISLPK